MDGSGIEPGSLPCDLTVDKDTAEGVTGAACQQPEPQGHDPFKFPPCIEQPLTHWGGGPQLGGDDIFNLPLQYTYYQDRQSFPVGYGRPPVQQHPDWARSQFFPEPAREAVGDGNPSPAPIDVGGGGRGVPCFENMDHLPAYTQQQQQQQQQHNLILGMPDFHGREAGCEDRRPSVDSCPVGHACGRPGLVGGFGSNAILPSATIPCESAQSDPSLALNDVHDLQRLESSHIWRRSQSEHNYSFHFTADDIPTSTSDGPAGKGGGAETSSFQEELENPEDEADAKALRQRIKKREAAKRLYHFRQRRIVELESAIERGIKKNAELESELAALLWELQVMQKRERELVETQKLAREEIQALKRQKQALQAAS